MVLLEPLFVIFMNGPKLVLDPVEVGVDASRLGQEITTSLGTRFGRSRFDEGGEAGLRFLLFADGSVLGGDQVVQVDD